MLGDGGVVMCVAILDMELTTWICHISSTKCTVCLRTLGPSALQHDGMRAVLAAMCEDRDGYSYSVLYHGSYRTLIQSCDFRHRKHS